MIDWIARRIGELGYGGVAALGALTWTSLLAIAGYRLESRYEAVAQYAEPVARILFVGLIGAYALRIWRHRRGSEAG